MTEEEALRQVKGKIFDIQRYSVHDGPGIRTIVFLKGCMFRCRWCCNPEGQEYETVSLQSMHGKPAKTAGEETNAGDVIDRVMKDRVYYARSGGGLTLSGGEMMLQPDFSYALLRLAHLSGISTAVETTGYAEKETIRKILSETDCVLMDIKHMNPEKHKAFIGKDNRKVLENAPFIAEHAARMIVRVPVIPTFNDTEEEIRAIAAFAKTLPGVTEMHLLPYHRLGMDKYTALGRSYPMGDLPLIPDLQMKKLLSAATEASGMLCQTGGE
ncbi:MAG: glycyl-radical enzyme activating protein [Clostridia bacterium]|nr:glycyl-radical enzyme activating protein [Clostridia bacterium]